MVAALHTASSDLRWHPHVHALASRGGWDGEGKWHAVPYVDEKAAELLFREKVISLLAGEDLLGSDRLELLDSWKSGHTGFSAHNRVTLSPGDGAGLERLARYLLRAPVSLERLELDGSVVHYRHKRATKRRGESFDAQDFLARLLQHIPAPRLHLVRYYGHYANAARAKRRKRVEEAVASEGSESARSEAMPCSAERRRLRRGWAQLIRRVYEVDPLLCPCGATMRILSFLTDPPVVRQILRHLESQSAERPRGPPRVGPEPSALAS
jgi:hypothetical protein